MLFTKHNHQTQIHTGKRFTKAGHLQVGSMGITCTVVLVHISRSFNEFHQSRLKLPSNNLYY